MLISRNWLQSYIEEELPSAEVLAERLGLHAFEIEGVESVGDDHVIDVDVLPNRAHDSLSYLGIAGEVAVVFDFKFKMPDMDFDARGPSSGDKIILNVEDSNLVPRAIKRFAENVKVGPSPEWLVKMLSAMGQQSINNIVDATNLIMFEFGQPIHAFDFDKLSKDSSGKVNISIRGAKAGEKITMLDGKEFELEEGVLVIADDKQALDIAGIKGGIVSGIDENTKNIMISVCNFEPGNIRSTSKSLGLRTDASLRFEKGLAPDLAAEAMKRVSMLIEEVSKADVAPDFIDEYPVKQKIDAVDVSFERTNKLLGTNISKEEFENILGRLMFKFENNGDIYSVTPPFFRLDLNIEEDLIEEIGRIYGYENIPEEEPYSGHGPVNINKEFYWVNKIKDILIEEGFSEVYNYSFTPSGEVELENGLSEDKKFLRDDLSLGLTKSIEVGNKNAPLLGVEKVKVFEIGTVFKNDREFIQLATSEDVSGRLEEILGVKVSGDLIDITKLLEKLPIPENYEDLEKLSFGDMKFSPISAYPFVLRDIAVWVPEVLKSSEVLEVIKNEAGDLFVNSSLFDEFKKDGRVSYAFRLVFQSHENTLTDDEVNKIMENITTILNSKEGFEVR